MSPDTEHAHAFPAEPGEPIRVTGDCECGMSIATFLQLHNSGSHTVGMSLDPAPAAPEKPLKFEIPAEVTRRIIIDWHVQQIPGAFIADHVGLTDAETGEPILTAIELHVHGKVGDYVVAELVTLADADGEPILDGEIDSRLSVDEDGSLATATTWWHVAEMRVGE